MKLRADVRDKAFLPAADATVEAHILGDGVAETVSMRPDALDAGVYTADWTVPKAGSYVVEVTAHRGAEDLGRDVITFKRDDGVAENFHVEQNRELLEKLSSETGGKYYKPEDAKKLGQRHQLFRSRHHRARNARSVGHAGDFPAAADAALRRMAAAPQVGCNLKRALLIVLASAVLARRDILFHRRRPRRRTRVRPALQRLGEGLDKLLHEVEPHAKIKTLYGADATQSQRRSLSARRSRRKPSPTIR